MRNKPTIQELALKLYSHLANRFPICCASDEFIFFPQALGSAGDRCSWDDLSPDAVKDSVQYLQDFQCQAGVSQGPVNDRDKALASLLVWVARTLEEQFTIVRTHATQPTFLLTVATVGLIQALESGRKDIWVERLRNLPLFLGGAFESLSGVPELYRDLGMEMADGIAGWLRRLEAGPLTDRAGEAVLNFAARLSRLPVRTDFHLEKDILERVVRQHTGSGLTIKEALGHLEDEISMVSYGLGIEAGRLGHGSDWRSAFSDIPGDAVPEGGKKELLSIEIGRLKDHCRRHGFKGLSHVEPDRLKLEYLPSSLDSIRAADSYNAIPGHPFPGGVFYIYGGGCLGTASGQVHPVYRMTAAHETYPGHHLLDLNRWNHSEAALRPIEYPLFYEGWACYGEGLMIDTCAFDRPCDNLILLRRRLRHAVRGKIDLLLHSGQMGQTEAAAELVSAGFARDRALETVRKYALRPAYQMCYTTGRRRFQRLFDSFAQGDITRFVNTVLSHGELLFEDLERVLNSSGEGEGEKRGGKAVPSERNGETVYRRNGE